ncbi:head GIN domain-containing protein [Flavobacterium chuncheonense]|uniref:Head GIN domain-containing protein n=1 Tax=Flavobacterium chuncheonense TaxID=2026653 RepID=A0ABW5YMC1_9FLAO
MKHTLYILLIVFTASCGISEDCLKGNGNPVTITFPFEGFSKVKVYSKIALVVKQGDTYEVKVETRDNIRDEIEVVLEGDLLKVKDISTCNIARDYGVTTVYVTAPNIKEIYSKTEQNIKSDGVLRYPELRVLSIDDEEGAGTGDFYLDVNNEYLYIESNSVSNFYCNGEANKMVVFFSWGDGIFYGSNLQVQTIDVFHRGSNEMIVYPVESLTGAIYGTGNVVLKNNPVSIDVNQLFTGSLIYN